MVENMDTEAFQNIRKWLEKALKKNGATITDSGFGGNQADLGITLMGMPYSVSIAPRKITDNDVRKNKTEEKRLKIWELENK